MICKQVTEPGLLTLPLLASQRTAMPTAQGVFTLSLRQIHRGCKNASQPAVGVAHAQNRKFQRETLGVAAGVAPIWKEMNYV